MQNNNAPESFVYDPSLISTLTVKSIRDAKNDPDILTTGIPQLDDHFVMLRPRRVVGVLAYTSHGKTSVMNILARAFVPQLKENEVILYATWEDSIEDMTLAHMAYTSRIPLPALYSGKLDPGQWDAMMDAAIKRAQMPLWLAGHSEAKDARRPRLTMTDIAAAMSYIVDKRGKKVRALFLDYLQRINTDDMRGDRRERFVSVMDAVKDIALAYNTTPIIGSQVGRDVKDRKNKQPQDHDAQETSNFEQTCDALLSLWIPKKSEAIGDVLIPATLNTPAVSVTDNLMMIQTLKQKRGKAPVLRAVDFIPESNEIRNYTPATVVNTKDW